MHIDYFSSSDLLIDLKNVIIEQTKQTGILAKECLKL